MFELTKYLSRRAAEEHFFIIIIVFNKAQIWWHLHYSCSILQHLRRSASRLERVIDHKRCDTLLLKEVSSSRSLLSSANRVTRCLPLLQNVFTQKFTPRTKLNGTISLLVPSTYKPLPKNIDTCLMRHHNQHQHHQSVKKIFKQIPIRWPLTCRLLLKYNVKSPFA